MPIMKLKHARSTNTHRLTLAATNRAFPCGSLISAMIYHQTLMSIKKGALLHYCLGTSLSNGARKSQQLRVYMLYCLAQCALRLCCADEFDVFRQFAVVVVAACFVLSLSAPHKQMSVCVRACVRFMRFTSSNTMQNSLIHCSRNVSMCLEPNNHCMLLFTFIHIHIHKLFSLILFCYRHSIIYLVQHETWLTANGTSKPPQSQSCDDGNGWYRS